MTDYSNSNQSVQKQIFAKGGYNYRGLLVSATALDKNTVFIAHSYHVSGDSTYSINGIVCKINGTTITLGTDTQIVDKTYNAGMAGFQAIGLDANRVFILFGENTTVQGNSCMRMANIACSISGTTITKGTRSTVTVDNYGGINFTGMLVDKDKVVVVYSDRNSSNSYTNNYILVALVFTINGTTVSHGTQTTLSSTAGSGKFINIKTLNNSKVFITHCAGTSSSSNISIIGRICTINGTTITNTATKTLFTGYNYGTSVHLVPLNENKVFLSYSLNNDKSLHTMICDINGTTITLGTDTQIVSSDAFLHSCQKLDENNVFIVYESSGLYIMICSIAGTVITAKSSIKILSKSYSNNLSSVSLDADNILLVYNYEDNNDLYAMVVNYVTNLVKKITSSTEKIGGVAITSGQNGEMITTVRPDDVMRIKVNATISTENFGSISWEDIILINRKIADRENNIYSPIKKLMINGENIDFKLGLYPYSDVYKDWRFGFEFSTELYYTANAKTKKYNNGTISKLNNLFAGNLYTGENKTGEHLSATANIEILS